MESPKRNEFAAGHLAGSVKTTDLERSSIFAPRPRHTGRDEMETSRRSTGRGWILFGALALVLGLVYFMGNGSLEAGAQSGDQLAGFAGGGAEIASPTSTPIPTEMPTFTSVPTATEIPLPTATFTPSVGIGSSWLRPADGMVMMYVPSGSFTMGVSAEKAQADCESTRGECKASWFSDSQPPHLVELGAYWMDQTEVTNAMYALCVNNGACKPPRQKESYNVEDYYDNPQYGNYPVIFIDWDQANAYCLWAGARLPTEAEWEKAARGTDERSFPWGDTVPSCGLLNFHPFNEIACMGDVTPVGEYLFGQSPYQILNMAGNVFEWVSDWWDRDYYANSPTSDPQGPITGQYKVLRGGAWYFDIEFARSTYRYKHDPRYHYSFTGFRCAQPE